MIGKCLRVSECHRVASQRVSPSNAACNYDVTGSRRRRRHASDVPVIPVVPDGIHHQSHSLHLLIHHPLVTLMSSVLCYEHTIRVCGVSFQISWSGMGADPGWRCVIKFKSISFLKNWFRTALKQNSYNVNECKFIVCLNIARLLEQTDFSFTLSTRK